MSTDELAAMLADPQQASVYFVTAQERQTWIEAAQLANVQLHRIDLRHAHDKAGLLAAIAEQLAFPQGFGNNWDALADALNDLSWLPPAKQRLLCFDHSQASVADSPEALLTLIDICEEAAERWADDGIAFWVLFEEQG